MNRKMYMRVTLDRYQLPIYYADSVRELARMCGVPSRKIEIAIKGPANKYKQKEYIMVVYDDEDEE